MAGGRVISAILTLTDRNFSSGLRRAADNTQDLQRQLKHTGNQISKFKNGAIVQFKGFASGVATSLAGVFAVSAIKDFGVSLVESAANAQATSAQFTQVFGNMQGAAQSTIDGMGKEFGMTSARIKPAMTTMTSMFKGLGMDTESAMSTAQSAVTLTADAAAFYDKSFEDANSALNSFIKGNYEGGEAIGLFANETQLASWASQNLGVDWKTLDEAGKQVARLQFAQAMQEAAGATGQASRESNSYQNQLGNLKSNWDTLKAKLGEKILEPAVNGIKSLSEWIAKVDTDAIIAGFTTFGYTVKEYAVPAIDGIKTGIGWIVDNKDTIIAATAGIVGGLVAFNVITGISSAMKTFNLLMVAYRTGTLMSTAAQLGLNMAMLASPFTWIAVAIGAVIAVGVLLWKNWDTVKAAGLKLWDGLKGVWSGIQNGFSNAWNAVKGAAESAVNGVINKINGLIKVINKIPGVNVPLVAKVDWTQAESPTKSTSKKKPKKNALGTTYFTGGLTSIHERGGEIVDLPNGTRIYPHDKSVKMARTENRNNSIIININGVNKSTDEILADLVPQLKIKLANM